MLVNERIREDRSTARAWQAAACGVAVALALLAPARGTAACKVEQMTLPVTMVGARAIATVGINGVDVRMMVDSGAFYSFLTDATADQLKLPVTDGPYGLKVQGLTGPVDARLTTVKRLQLLKGEVPDVEFIVGGNEPGSGAMGVLGRNLLAFMDTEYDLSHGAIRFMRPNDDCDDKVMAYWAGDTPIAELKLERDRSTNLQVIRTTVKLNGRDVRALFDTGATTTLVSLSAAHRAGLTDADLTPDGMVYGMGRDMTKSWTARFDRIELGGEAIANNRMRVAEFADTGVDMLIGIDFFLSHRIYVSKARHRMFFTYNGGAVFALNTAAAAEPAASGASSPEDADQPTDAAGYARRGAAFAARHDFEHALADLDRACEMAPQSADPFAQRGAVHVALRQLPQALQDFDTALRLDPTHADARLQRASLRVRSGDRDGALDDLRVLDETLAPQAHMRLRLAQLYAGFGMDDKALAQWNQWIPAHPNEVGIDSVLNRRCWVRTMLGVELDKALDDCDKALDRQPKNAAFVDSRAWLHLRRGELRDARSDFDRSLELKANGASSLYGRGLVRIKQGDAVQGRVDLEAARKIEPGIDATLGRYGLAVDPSPAPATSAATSAATPATAQAVPAPTAR